MDDRGRPLRVVHLTGSPVDDGWADLSRLYAGQALDALRSGPHADRWEHVVVDVSPDGSWRFPNRLDTDGLADVEPLDRADALGRLVELDADVGVPQMFCRPGLTDHRSLLSLLGIPSVGNGGSVMDLTADKSKARAVIAAAGVSVPSAALVRRSDSTPTFAGPVVVKPVDADNSVGVMLVEDEQSLADAIAAALDHADAALVEDFVPLGREVRCGTIRRDGRLVALPLEEYAVDATTKPIRLAADKLARTDDGDLRLVAKNDDLAWIVDDGDPIVTDVHDLALTAHEALGCTHHGLVDVRVDPDGRPWFIEAGPYCSFAPGSVVVAMAAARGISLAELFADAVHLALGVEADLAVAT